MCGWQAVEFGGVIHVLPVSDLRPHTLDDRCWCGPDNDEGVIVHHSMDGREAGENGRKQH